MSSRRPTCKECVLYVPPRGLTPKIKHEPIGPRHMDWLASGTHTPAPRDRYLMRARLFSPCSPCTVGRESMGTSYTGGMRGGDATSRLCLCFGPPRLLTCTLGSDGMGGCRLIRWTTSFSAKFSGVRDNTLAVDVWICSWHGLEWSMVHVGVANEIRQLGV